MGLIRAMGKMASKGTAKVGGTGNALNLLASGYFGVSAYNTARDEGNGTVASFASGAMEAALPMVVGNVGYLAYIAATELPSAGVSAIESYGQYGRNLARNSNQAPFRNAQFAETQGTYTMRQAGMALAQKSKYSLQQTTLGNEAQYMHR